MKLKLPKVVLAMLEQRGAIVDPELHASRAQLIKTCEEHRYTSHASVISFEAAFGGLVIPEGKKMKRGEPCWIFGAYACLTSGAHTNSSSSGGRRKLVPVIYSPNDIIYYLDDRGRGYAKDTIEDTSAFLCADDGTSLVCRVLLNDIIFSRTNTSVDLPGLNGDSLANELALTLIPEASGKDHRFFTDNKGEIIVVEDVKDKRTRFAGATKKQLTLVKEPVPLGVDNATPEMVPYLGKASVRMVSEQRTSLPEFFERLPDLRELEVNSNKLETLPESLWRALQLTKLDLSFNPLKELPDGIGNLKALRSLFLRGCPITTLPDALAGAKNLTKLVVSECEKLDVDATLPVIAKLPKLSELSLPLSVSLTSLAPLAKLPLKSLTLNGLYVKTPVRLPSGLGQLKKLTDLRIEYANDVAQLPDAPEDVLALRLIFSKRFTDDDIRKSVQKQPEVLYLRAFAEALKA